MTRLTRSLALAMLALMPPMASATPSDFLTEPIRTLDQIYLAFDVRHPWIIQVRPQGGGSLASYFWEAGYCTFLQGFDWHCEVPVAPQPSEVQLVDDEGGTGVGWRPEVAEPPPGQAMMWLIPDEVGTPHLRWKISSYPNVAWFMFEYAAVDVSRFGNTQPVWYPYDQPDRWAYCYEDGHSLKFICIRAVPVQNAQYRVKACNYYGCSPAWTYEFAFGPVACIPTAETGTVGGGCPCLTFPSRAGCIP